MRPSIPLAALPFALLELASGQALGGARSRVLADLAEVGLLPDGTPMSISSQVLSNLKFTTIQTNQAPPKPEVITPEYVELPLNHFGRNDNDGTFFNRFWVAESAYKPGGPVFLYDVGEANASTNALFRLQNETSFFKQIVDQYHGIGIVWEHRYYGNSTPVPINLDTPPQAFKWLNTEQSLADVDYFAWQFKRKNIKAELTPDKTPWVFVGGSYPAMRAAFMRDQYPETIFASYASSAPTQAQIDMSVYFEPVYRGLNAYGFGNCTKDIYAAVNYIDKLVLNSTAAVQLKEQFLGKGAGANSHATFADALSVIYAYWQSYGVEGGQASLRYFCDWIETDPATGKVAGAEGWAASKGAKFTVDRWANWVPFVAMVNSYLETECSGSAARSGNCDLNRRFSDPASIAWTWQYCTQWGYFQSANLGPHQLLSKYNSLQHQRDICHRQFPTAPRSLLPEWPAVAATNRRFGGWDIRPSQVYWSGGEFDPWRTLSPLSSEPFAPAVQPFQDPPKCGQGSSTRRIFGYTMKNAEHCFDFRTYFVGGEVSRKYFTDALSSWLGCFRPGKGRGRERGRRFVA